MQLPSGLSMNFKTSQSSRATNIMQPECNPAYTPIPPPSMTDYVFPSPSNMDYTPPPIFQPDDFLSNVLKLIMAL